MAARGRLAPPLPSALVDPTVTAYRDLLYRLSDKTLPFHTLTLQICFLVYLVAAQFLLLFVWRRLSPANAPPSRWRDTAFGAYLLFAQAGLLLAWPYLANAWLAADPILLADVVVTFHLGLVLLVPLTLLLVVVGLPLGWKWTRNFWVRLLQLLVIEVVAGQAVVGIECPLTTLERVLRGGAGFLHELDDASAVGRFCNEVLYYDPPPQGMDESARLAGNAIGAASNVLPSLVILHQAVEHDAAHRGIHPFFIVVYVSVGLLVLLTWVLIPPRLPWRPTGARGSAHLPATSHTTTVPSAAPLTSNLPSEPNASSVTSPR